MASEIKWIPIASDAAISIRKADDGIWTLDGKVVRFRIGGFTEANKERLFGFYIIVGPYNIIFGKLKNGN